MNALTGRRGLNDEVARDGPSGMLRRPRNRRTTQGTAIAAITMLYSDVTVTMTR